MTSWEVWATGVLAGIKAPLNAVNADTLWAWSNAETAPYDLMRWQNPMNSTEKWPSLAHPTSKNSGAQPGLHDVQIYASLQDGIDATAYTLVMEPYYGAIVANLRNSVPRQKWGATSTAGAQLHAWGTGTNWLTATPYFGPVPDNFGDEMADYDPNTMPGFHAVFKQLSAYGADSNTKLDAINTTLAGLPSAIGKAIVVPPPTIDVNALATAIVAAMPAQNKPPAPPQAVKDWFSSLLKYLGWA